MWLDLYTALRGGGESNQGHGIGTRGVMRCDPRLMSAFRNIVRRGFRVWIFMIEVWLVWVDFLSLAACIGSSGVPQAQRRGHQARLGAVD